ncbi:hypothetical protein A1Q1_08019 [Trichosporon asahii var. asahii CBS 2479]|uniref:PROP1-like PPR domain-containing protein n=1 Tax=Trichosporon asahii var. asahii (strain ATCC 90039 / CBS 2479 / JCM 2466 / KCTC 7840 / NBRC 103889/ NCYC 2677 / UAMH 7654) TaxID=1186058 RepID=J5TGE8_TRIAS|nr:hypothetical protein A1Q1_08019 [Trichosporon asahii var. asahii CBS 2479]EJT50806.1 hypothetical protein A1Q1_08019 [Trichosporon asahii var. asahii CBS 2479]
MLGKAATHIRPLWRLQSHSHQPDLFTSNPSLLHHFQTPGANALATQGASAASGASGGAAGGAGRAGYSGASSGGGYTGHARAFLSMSHGPGADASTGVNAADDSDAKYRQRAHLALKQRISTSARDEPTTQTVVLRQRLAARAGSRQVRAIEIPEEREASKRASIAYPSWAALPADAAPGGALWIPGAAPQRLGAARAFSTRATRLPSEPELVTATPSADSARIKQPNRVLMDLAGLDLSRPNNRIQVRRNSTASVVRPDADEIAASLAKESSEQRDKAIYDAIFQAPADQAEALIAHYRTPRSAAEPAEGDPALAAKYPLPAGYSVQTYNNCILKLLRHRERGQSIAPILDIYNEMLARDVVPNVRTSALVVRALCLRDEDVAFASHGWQRGRDWQQFKAEQLGLDTRADSEAEAAAEAAILAYQNENNLGSALKLYGVAQSFYPRHVRNDDMVTDLVNAAAANAKLPSGIPIEQIDPVIAKGLKGDAFEPAVYQKILEIYAASGDANKFRAAWDKFLSKGKAVAAGNPAVVGAAIAGVLKLGNREAAEQIAAEFSSEEYAKHVASAMVEGLTEAGELDAALQWFGKSKDLYRSEAYALANALAEKGRFDDVRAVVKKAAQHTSVEKISNGFPARLMGRLLAYALKAEDKKAALQAALDVQRPSAAMDAQVIRLFAELLVANGLAAEVPRMLEKFSGAEPTADADLRAIIMAVVQSDASFATLLDTLRATARLGGSLVSTGDMMDVSQAVVDKYLATRSSVPSAAEMGYNSDRIFRLLEAIVSLPETVIESGKADPVLEHFMGDLAEISKSFYIAGALPSSQGAAALADILTARFGPERAANLLTAALGDKALGILPNPGSTTSPTDSSFTMPPTPTDAPLPGEFQPPSPHTLHIVPQLTHLIERVGGYRDAPETAQGVYATIRDALTNDNAVPSPEGLGRLMTALAREGDEAKVRELYSLAQVVLTSCLADPVAQADGWRKVEDAMISACCFLGHLEQAGMHRARIIDAGLTPSADAYATMIASSRDSTDDALVARELFDESQALGVIPHLYLYNTIISKLSKARKAEVALELFEHMKAAGVRPSSVTYGAVINACCRVGDEESAVALFDEMSAAKNFRPRVPPYNTMMQFYLQTRPDRARVLEYYDAMRAAGVHPSAHTYKLLLDAFGTLQPLDLTSMDRIFAELVRNRHVPVQGTHYASLITAHGLHANDVAKAKAIFNSLKRPQRGSPAVIEPVVWGAILNVVGQRGTLEELESLRAELERSGSPSTAYVCNVLIAGYSRHGRLDAAREVFESMADSVGGVAAPNNHPTLLTSSGHKKPATTAQAPAGLVFREPSTYEAMIRAELAAGNRAEAEAILARMEERRYPVAVWMKARAIFDDAWPAAPAAPAAAAEPVAEAPKAEEKSA